MFLVHNTDISGLKSILKDGYIKSYSLLKNQRNLSHLVIAMDYIQRINLFILIVLINYLTREYIQK